jgi:hypothetical protein
MTAFVKLKSLWKKRSWNRSRDHLVNYLKGLKKTMTVLGQDGQHGNSD